MTITPPPLYDPIVGDDGKVNMSWTLFFNNLFGGDPGNNWTPHFVSLSTTGTPSFSGTYYKISAGLAYFTAIVTPATDTSAVAGTTYIDNFPLVINKDGAVLAVSGTVGSSAGIAQGGTSRIYVPAWTNITVPVTICGIVEAT